MIYEFKSDDGEIIEIKKSMTDTIPEKINKKGKVYRRIFSVPHIMFLGNALQTLGALAERNTERMRKEGKLPPKKKGAKMNSKDKKHLNDLSKMSEHQKEKYIWTGEKS